MNDNFKYQLLKMLRYERQHRGFIPVSSDEIIERWNAVNPDDLIDPEKEKRRLGLAGEELRDEGYPVVGTFSEPSGYMYCETLKEYMEIVGPTIGRAKRTLENHNRPIEKFKKQNQENLEFPEHPIVKALQKEFEAVKV